MSTQHLQSLHKYSLLSNPQPVPPHQTPSTTKHHSLKEVRKSEISTVGLSRSSALVVILQNTRRLEPRQRSYPSTLAADHLQQIKITYTISKTNQSRPEDKD